MKSPGVFAALGSALLFGAATPLAKLLLGDIDPWLLASLLYLGSGLGLAAYRLVRACDRRTQLAKNEWRWLAGAVVAGGIVGPVLLMYGLTRLPASSASLLLNAEGAFTALLAWFVFRENFDLRIAGGMTAILLGAMISHVADGRCSVGGDDACLERTGCLSGLGRGQQPDTQGVAGGSDLDRVREGAGSGYDEPVAGVRLRVP
jgi:drug/metabolite transporter (DMT)-like permease